MSEPRAGLRQELDSLSREAGRAIRSQRRRAAAVWSFKLFLPLMMLVPAVWLILLIGFGTIFDGLSDVSIGWIVVIAVLFLAAAVLVAVIAAGTSKVDRRDSLAVLDRELGLEDRLVTAEEFISRIDESPFIAAALDDAARIAPAAHAAVLGLERQRLALGAREFRILAVGAFLFLLGAWTTGGKASERGDESASVTRGDEVAVINTHEDDATTRPNPKARDEHQEPEPTETAPAKTAAAETRRDKSGQLSDETKESEGKTGEGRSSDAESTSGASQSRGMPSNQSQQSKAGEKTSKKEAKKKAKPPAELKPAEKKQAEENSGSTAGKGSSKGSNKNPAVSKWSSKDQVTTQDDQEIEDDEETEDEEEDQESRGGMQPNLRDRKPPVSRDLRIGFGNQKNPDANGRGGPSEAKKSRGTASLVLGVPIPDRVKGQPNPGKTKITQERIEPKAEESAAISASGRKPRVAPAGNVQERELTPWMRTLIREYFLNLRNENRQS